jgi:GNAT superfamily N-acetyltransferase
MITLVGVPGRLPPEWRREIVRLHGEFCFDVTDGTFSRHWWWISSDEQGITGFAGGMVDVDDLYFLGPCGVRERARGRGLQRAFIRRRIATARGIGAPAAVTFTNADNIYSANNFILEGFVLVPPWKHFIHTDESLFFSKRLNV